MREGKPSFVGGVCPDGQKAARMMRLPHLVPVLADPYRSPADEHPAVTDSQWGRLLNSRWKCGWIRRPVGR
jgi:hypothetical protein